MKDDIISRETSSLTKAQAAAVKKRVDTLNATLRKKQKQKDKQKADVRDLFTPSQVYESNFPPCLVKSFLYNVVFISGQLMYCLWISIRRSAVDSWHKILGIFETFKACTNIKIHHMKNLKH